MKVKLVDLKLGKLCSKEEVRISEPMPSEASAIFRNSRSDDDDGESAGAGGDTVTDVDDDMDSVDDVEADVQRSLRCWRQECCREWSHGHVSEPQTEAAVTQMDGRSCGKAWPEAFDAVARYAAAIRP